MELEGKVCLVTGSTGGLGRAICTGLAGAGATVVLHGRDVRKLELLARDIRREHPDATLDLVLADLSSLSEVRRLTREVRARFARVHALINNAAVVAPQLERTVDGFELTWAVNVLAPYLLVAELLGCLEAAAPGRVVNLVSGLARLGRWRLEDVHCERHFGCLSTYWRSKRALASLTSEWSFLLRGQGVAVLGADPGLAVTGLMQRLPGWHGEANRLLCRFARPPDVAATPAVKAAVAPELRGCTGALVTPRLRVRTHSWMHREGPMGARLHALCGAHVASSRKLLR